MSRTDFNTLLEAGAHFGHLKRKWNPKMAPYIFMEKNGILFMSTFHPAALLRGPQNKPNAFADFVALRDKIHEVCKHTYE